MTLFKILKDALMSIIPPKRKDCLWIKPLKEGGVALFVLYQGKWQPVKLVSNDGGTMEDDDVITPVANITEGTANGTIKVDDTNVKVHGLGGAAYHAENYYATPTQAEQSAQNVYTSLYGDPADEYDPSSLTLEGLKKYIDSIAPDTSGE